MKSLYKKWKQEKNINLFFSKIMVMHNASTNLLLVWFEWNFLKVYIFAIAIPNFHFLIQGYTPSKF